MKIERESGVMSVIMTNDASTSQRLRFSAVAGGVLIADASDTITWYVSATPEGTAAPLLESDGTTPVTTSIVSGSAVALPDALFAAPYIVGVVTSGGGVTATICVKA